jgi:PAS domain S-box-containing protein
MPAVKKILLVDDDAVSSKSMDHVLRSFGYSAVIASDGREALEKMNDAVELVLLDVVMPGMDGFEVARLIREHPEYGDVPIIMVTSLTGKADRLIAVQAGANDFVTKPIDRVELEIRIAAHLKLKRAQDKRRECDARYRTLVENSPVGILFCNRDGDIEQINTAAASLFGISTTESKRPRNLFDNSEFTTPEVSELLKSCLESGETNVREFPFGKERDQSARLQIVPIRDRGGYVSGLQVVCEDISDRRKAEELSRRRTRLTAFAEMARGSVAHFSEALKAIDEQVIAGTAAIDSGDQAAAGTSLEKIGVSAKRASRTLDLLAKFARGYSRRDKSTRSVFNFATAIEDALEASRPAWKTQPDRKGIKIDLERNCIEKCLIEGEREDVTDVAAHLIRNAAESMPEGGRLGVRTFLEKDYVVLEVQDSGVGMTQAQMAQVGFPFRTSKQAHAGLGLAVTLGIIRRHSGTFFITSKKGLGTTFTVKFPLVTKRKEEIEELTIEIMASNPKTLFVDPDAVAGREFSAEFSGKGPVYYARSIEEALSIIHEKNIDAIVCSGALLAAQIAELSKSVGIFCANKGTVRPPFILLSEEGRPSLHENGPLEVHVDRVVPKSINMSDLGLIIGQEIRSALNRPRIAGNMGHIDILDVAQMMLLSGQKLVVEIISEKGVRGLMYISNGEISHAVCGDMEGEAAAYWALGLKAGYFSSLAWTEPEKITITKPGQLILMEAARRRDENMRADTGSTV